MKDYLIAAGYVLALALAFAAFVSLFMPWRWDEVRW
jgi:hypothetical protein